MICAVSLNLAHALGRLDSRQQRSPALAVPIAVIEKFLKAGADALGVQIAYWGFFSVFGLLLVFTSMLGFVFQSDPSHQHELLNSTLERMPVIGPQISRDIGTLTGSGVALAVGLTGAAVDRFRRDARDRHRARSCLGGPRVQRAGFISSKLRGLLVLASCGTINVSPPWRWGW